VLRGEYDYEKLKAFFDKRPWEVRSVAWRGVLRLGAGGYACCEPRLSELAPSPQVATRFAQFAAAFATIARTWLAQESWPPETRTRGEVLRDNLSRLGAATVKCGQTLAERPDLIGEEAASYLKQLQGENAPFDNALAWQMIAEDLDWPGPLAPGCPHAAGAAGPSLFSQLSSSPVAAASLAQVYYAVTHDGKELAIKVQRPQLLRNVALDMLVLRMLLGGARRFWNTIADLRIIADEVAAGVFRELDVHAEAANAAEFQRRLAFLGFVRTPAWEPRYSGPRGTARVLAMEWVRGRRLQVLPPQLQRRFVDMAVEASVAQLIRTGFVHADPHAGNLLLDDDGRLVFLDFGLMCTVEPHIMEAFAAGVVHLLAGDWRSLALDFQACGLVPELFEAKNKETGLYEIVSVDVFADGIRQAICGEADGLTRFGALATGLGGASGTYRFLCPPFIILLCRTFLTLEGMAAVVDPDFSIYSSALPYAVRRALSPETAAGEATLRRALLTEEGAFRWGRLNEVLQQMTTLQQARPDVPPPPPPPPSGAQASGGASGVVAGLLGAPEGAALRRVLRDADSLLFVAHLAGAEGRPLRRAGVQTLAASVQAWHGGARWRAAWPSAWLWPPPRRLWARGCCAVSRPTPRSCRPPPCCCGGRCCSNPAAPSTWW
jgi:predicted unusual protein kinase regulating ubiquinone biosynthesis (AarF/ABC1/UbiB family)